MESTHKKAKKTPYAHLFRLTHWIISAGTILLILSGYGIDGVSISPWSILDNYPTFYPGMRIIYWHKIIGMIFAPTAIIAFIIFVPRMANMRVSNLRRISTILLIGSAVVCAITSIGLIYSNIPAVIYHTCRFLHTICGLIVAPVSLLIHIYLALFKYFPLLVPSFAPIRQARWLHILWLAGGLLLSWVLFTRYIPYHLGSSELWALKTSLSISEAENIDKLPWNSAEPLDIQLVNGIGFKLGITRARLRAFYNDTHLYMRIEWEDDVYNRIYRPWVKTESAWMHLNPGGSDERIYNEDKFALLFPISEDADFRRYGCSVYCHADQKNGHSRHWTFGNTLVDAWHWKSVRTDPFGNVDDKYWLGTGEISDDSDGRHGDPGEGGHANNLVEGVANPIMLPTSLDSITMGALIQSKAEIYTQKAAEKLPVGFEVPGAIISEAEGDRADIRCISAYRNGTWRLEVMRKLDTGSDYDVVFSPGGKYDFTVTAFDHNANRHSYSHEVYRLYLVP
jgi:Ni,Fe-hydrogenase I cytochrome b subunit